MNPTGHPKSTSILLCGLEDHAKPHIDDIKAALEKWISGFDASKLAKPITVSFATTYTARSGNPPKLRSSPPTVPHLC